MRTYNFKGDIKMKKIIALLLVVVMAMTFVACGSSKNDPSAKSKGVMTYEEYAATPENQFANIEAYVQATQSWWDNKITIYAQDPDGAYFLYNMVCPPDLAEKLVPGTKILAKGTKSSWAGEVEIAEGTIQIVEGPNWIAEPMDATALLGTEELITHQNKKVAFKGMTVEASTDADGNEAAFLYNWDGSGAEGSDSDLYFNASINGNTYTFCVEYYLCGPDSQAYQAVQGLKVGDVIDMEGFLYWYEGAQPHITAVTAG